MLFAFTICFESLFYERRFTLDLHHSGSFRQPVETVAAPCLNHHYNTSILQVALVSDAGRGRQGEMGEGGRRLAEALLETGEGGVCELEGLPI